MPLDIAELVKKQIEAQAKSPEQKERLIALLETMPEELTPPSTVSVNMFELTAALCAAAQCIGSDAVNMSKIYTSSVKIAEAFFTREGTFIERG